MLSPKRAEVSVLLMGYCILIFVIFMFQEVLSGEASVEANAALAEAAAAAYASDRSLPKVPTNLWHPVVTVTIALSLVQRTICCCLFKFISSIAFIALLIVFR